MEIEHVVEDDGRIRTGTVWTATAHAITAIVGSGVLTLPWSVAQFGWIIGPTVLVLFAFVTYYTAILLVDSYRFPGPINGRRNYTYMDAIRAFLGEKNVMICGVVQYLILWGTMVGYTVTAAMSMMAIKRSDCFHAKGRDAPCKVSGTLYVIIFCVMEVILSQFPNLEKISFLSYTAAAMSFAYSFIGLYLCVVQLVLHHEVKGNLLGVNNIDSNISSSTKVWHAFQALGNIAFAYTYAMVLIEIQVFAQPLFAFYEQWLATKWPNSGFFNRVYTIRACLPKSGSFKFTLCKLLVRSLFVLLTTMVAVLLPFFNAIVGLLGSLGFWTLTVYYPVTMHMAQHKIKKGGSKWMALQVLSFICLLVSLVSIIGSVAGIVQHLRVPDSLK